MNEYALNHSNKAPKLYAVFLIIKVYWVLWEPKLNTSRPLPGRQDGCSKGAR